MTATLRYKNGTGAVYATPEEAIAQARHDLVQPMNNDPLDIIDGDASRDLAAHIVDDHGMEWSDSTKIIEAKFNPCDCLDCQFQIEAPKLDHHNRAVLAELFGARAVLQRDLTPDEIVQLERVIGTPQDTIKRLRPIAGGAVPAAGFSITWTAIALVAATNKTIAAVLTSANTPVDLPEASVSGDATSGNLLAELCFGTNATTGTSTAFTPLQFRGRAQTMAGTAAINYTVEPTVITVIKRWRMPWPGGPFVLQSPLSREMNSVITAATIGKQFTLRLNSSVAANTDGYIEVEE